MQKNHHETFKHALSSFASGVCIITFTHPTEQCPDGVTISAFASLSLSPEKILFCLGDHGQIGKTFAHVSQFVVNILNIEQKALAYQFAGRNRENLAPHWQQINRQWALKDSLAHLVCQTGKRYQEGDHHIIIGDVKHIELTQNPKSPLLYYHSTLFDENLLPEKLPWL